jgi:hypothetical protein
MSNQLVALYEKRDGIREVLGLAKEVFRLPAPSSSTNDRRRKSADVPELGISARTDVVST